MLGTLNGALEVRGIRLEPDAIRAEAEGINEIVDGLPVLTEIRIRYRLRILTGDREALERALARHQSKCPTAASLQGSVAVTWKAEIEEEA
ncbi:MAG TPA: OsmC family protein [Thermoanaerobaculia bacterium]|nr:OsmC family protein [Thermoanaerobaculia bacterium]